MFDDNDAYNHPRRTPARIHDPVLRAQLVAIAKRFSANPRITFSPLFLGGRAHERGRQPCRRAAAQRAGRQHDGHQGRRGRDAGLLRRAAVTPSPMIAARNRRARAVGDSDPTGGCAEADRLIVVTGGTHGMRRRAAGNSTD
jgi:hypothetical protein